MSQKITKENLQKECLRILGISLEDLLKIVRALGQIQKIMNGPLYVQRFAGLLRSTNKEDPLDCGYIQSCVIEWLEQPEEFQHLIEGLKIIVEKFYE